MTTDAPPPGHDETPVGREQVAAAVLEAAAELFAERGPEATSIRDIAARANVNHGLVYRHFGTKERLVGAVLEHLGGALTDMLADGGPADGIDDAIDRHMRVMARALLDGYPVGQLQTRFPGVARLLDEVLPKFADDTSARLAAANAVALELGWRLFEPFLRSATGLEALPEAQVRAAAGAEVARLLDPDATRPE